jgi:hypothetical protein
VFKSLLSAIFTAVVLTSTGGATPDPGGTSTTYFRGWAIFGTQPYFQIWNPGPGRLCVKDFSVSANAQSSGAVLLMHEPLPEDISTWDRNSAKDQGYNAASPNGIDIASQADSRGQLRASVGSVRYGGQMWSFRLRTNMPYTIRIDDCLAAGKGLGIRIGAKPGQTIQVHFGASWTE